MMKWVGLLILVLGANLASGAVLISVSNSMMTELNDSSGAINLGTFDPFEPEANCVTYTAPNTCTANGRNPVEVSLGFDYSIEIDVGSASGIDLVFVSNNGLGGTTGEFTNLQMPEPLFNLTNGSSGNFNVDFQIPMFGPQSSLQYGMELTVEITVNP